jgi:hypothetical protein
MVRAKICMHDLPCRLSKSIHHGPQHLTHPLQDVHLYVFVLAL